MMTQIYKFIDCYLTNRLGILVKWTKKLKGEFESMLYLSEKTGMSYKTVKELEEAEKALAEQEAEKTKLADIKKARAKEVEDAYLEYENVKEQAFKQIADAEKKWIELRDKFAETYGGYHMTYVNDNGKKQVTFDDLVRSFFNF